MSYNTQNPYFWTLDGTGVTNNLEVVGATYISIYNDTSVVDTTSVSNTITGQSINLPSGCVMELSPDTGCTLQTIQILPNGSNITYVTMIGGTAQLV